jgi:hypothetical protein
LRESFPDQQRRMRAHLERKRERRPRAESALKGDGVTRSNKPSLDDSRANPTPVDLYSQPSFKFPWEVKAPLESSEAAQARPYPHLYRKPTRRELWKQARKGS